MSTVSQGVKRTESYVYNSLHWAFPLAPILAKAATTYTTSWDGHVIEWGEQMDVRRLDVAR